VPVSYRYPSVPVTRFLDDAARDYPTATALRFRGRSWQYGELRDLVDRGAALLLDLGVRTGDRVALVTPTTPAAVVATFAAWRVGAVLAPLDPDLRPDVLRDRLVGLAPSVVVADVGALDDVLAVRPDLPGLRHVVASDPAAWLRPRERVLASLAARVGRRRAVRPDDDVVEFDLLLQGGPALVRQVATLPTEPAAVLFTGGTTGDGRGVVLTHGNLVANAFQSRLWVPDVRAGGEVVLATVPLWHSYGLTAGLLTGVLAAATVVLLPESGPEAVLDAIEAERVTLLPSVPRLYEALVRADGVAGRDLSSVRAAVSGGAALEAGVRHAFEQVTGGRLRQGYGLTEAGPITHANPVYGRTVDGAVGLPVTDTVALVRDLDDPERVLAPGELGELMVAGPQVAPGYWEGPGSAPDPVGPWLATGDLAEVDADGVCRVHGRVEDLAHRDGRRIVPAVVERALLEHPGVARAVVVGVGDGDDQRLHALVVARPRARLTTEELRVHAGQLLAPDLLPDRVHVRDELPESVLGKVLRHELRAELADRGDLPAHDAARDAREHGSGHGSDDRADDGQDSR